MGSGADKMKYLEDMCKDGKEAAQQATSNDRQVGGSHYRSAGGYQHWDIVVDHKLNYFEAQILRYTMRCRRKGRMLEDLEKAKHFIEKYIELTKDGKFGLEPEYNQIHTDHAKTCPCEACRPELYSKAHLSSTI